MDQQPQATTPSKKRRHSEYHDPDYHQTQPPAQQQQNEPIASDESKRLRMEQETQEKRVEQAPSDETLRRICELVRQEFQCEINQKVEQLTEIDRRLLQARQLLDRLRYLVVNEYYHKQQVPLTAADVAKVRGDSLFSDDGSQPQKPLHPAIKKIVGKRPLPIQNHLPERTAATLAKQTIRQRNPANRRAERRRQQKIRDQGIVIDHSKDTPDQQEPPVPAPVAVKLEDEQPCTSRQAYERQLELNASRLNNKNKFNFVVGNTSKYIGEGIRESSSEGQAMIYKWLVYVQGKDLAQPLNTYLKKVRFQLHHSYRPNDIVDVHNPPFQLSRHGWGEFPMRIQLFFQEALQQKPVQLIHTVILDKTMSGLHTMGAETTVEIWLRAEQALTTNRDKPVSTSQPPPVLADLPEVAPSLESCKPRTISITQNKEELDDNLFAGINKIELSDDIEKIEPTVLVSEPLKLSYSPRKQQPPQQLRLNATPVSASRPSVVYLPVNGRVPKQEPLSEQEQRLEVQSQRRWQEALSERSPIKPVRNGHHHRKKNMVFQKAGKLYIIDHQQRKLKQAAKQQSLLKPQLSLLKAPTATRWHFLQCIQHDHGYANMSTSDVDEKPVFLHSVTTTVVPPRPRRLEQTFVSIQVRSMRSAVEFLLRRLPLTRINQKAKEAEEEENPFTCSTLEVFQEKTALKQRCYEYLRARLLRRYLTQHHKLQQLDASGREHYWSLREIVAFARIHGYTPPLKMLMSSGECKEQSRKLGAGKQLAQRVQEQLKAKPQPQLSAYCSLTTRDRLDAWMDKQRLLLKGHEQKMLDEEFIDVLGVDRLHSKDRSRPNRMSRSHQEVNGRTLLYLPPPEHLDSATQLVQVMCKDIDIKLEPEESMPGVSQPVALTLLAHVLRTFVDRLVRRSVAVKLQQDTMEQLPPAASNSSLCLQPHDIGRAIGQCVELDFLGNTHLGVEPMEPQT